MQTGRVCVTPLKHIFISVLGSMSVEPGRDAIPWRGYDKVPKTEWLRTIEMYHLPVLEARSLRSKCPQGHASSEGPSGGSSLPLPDSGAPGVPWSVAESHQSLPPCSHGPLPCSSVLTRHSFRLCVFSHFLIRTPVTGFRAHPHPLSEKAMAPHSSTLAWKIPWTEGPGGLQSMGSLRVRHD